MSCNLTLLVSKEENLDIGPESIAHMKTQTKKKGEHMNMETETG